MRQLVSNPRRLRLVAGAVVAGAALFASGVFVANAIDSDKGKSGDDGSKAAIDVARDGAGNTGAPASFNPEVDFAGAGRAESDEAVRLSLPRGGCQVPIPGLLAAGAIDPAAIGFTASYLGAAFDLTSFTIRAEADCPDGVTPSGETHLVLDTGWKHRDTGLAVYVSQRQGSEPAASVLEETSARFSRDGYTFSVNADGYSVQPLAGRSDADDGGPDIARDLIAGIDPRAGEVLRAALADLSAPAEACFYTAREGSLDDIVAMGLGDPRGAIPAGYTLQEAHVRAWNAPAADCGAVPADGLQTSLNATWIQDGGFGGIWVSAYSVSEGEQAYAGSANNYYANWSNGSFHFNVGLKTDPAPADSSLLRTLATAIDPNFANACVALEGELSDADLTSTGFAIPTAPDGYETTEIAHRGSTLTGNCSTEARQSYSNSVSGTWTMTGPGGATINVHAYESGPIPEAEKRGYIADNNISFFANSVQYSINGYNERGGDAPSLDTLIAVATSIDPAFNPDSLEKVQGGGTSPGAPGILPMPAEDKPQ